MKPIRTRYSLFAGAVIGMLIVIGFQYGYRLAAINKLFSPLTLHIIAGGSTNLIVDIRTYGKSPTFYLNNINMSNEQIVAWMKDCIERFGDQEEVTILADDQTKFPTVFELISSLQSCGVKHFVFSPGFPQTSTVTKPKVFMTTAEEFLPPQVPH